MEVMLQVYFQQPKRLKMDLSLMGKRDGLVMQDLQITLLFGQRMLMKAIKFKDLSLKKVQQAFLHQRLKISLVLECFKSILILLIFASYDIEMKDVFVPSKNRLAKALDFASGANNILKHSRLFVAWCAVGAAAGAIEDCFKYSLQRK